MYSDAPRDRKHVTSTVSPLVSASICRVLSEAEKPSTGEMSADRRNLPTKAIAHTENTKPSDNETADDKRTAKNPRPLRRMSARAFAAAKSAKAVSTT